MNTFNGKILSSRYRLDSVIGEGGMAIVYKGFDLITKVNLAVKVLKDGDCFNRIENVIRLKREAAAVSRLDHPGIIKVLDIGASEDVHYLVMEFIEGESLESFIENKDSIQVPLILSIIRRIAETLAYVHDAGIIHRDIKPGNIILTKSAAKSGPAILPKVGDFGLSRIIGHSRNNTPETSGTYCYMSPEQAGLIRCPVDYRTDLYSLGVLASKLLTGRLPFQGRDVSELFHQMLTFTPQRPSRLNPEIPEILDEVIARLLERDPEKRYQTAEGLCHDLRRIETGGPLERLSCDDPARRIIFHTRHIGREKPLEILQTAFRNASRGSGSVCLVSGEAGSGKSRLCDEFATWALRQNALCLTAGCLSQDNQAPYQIFSDLLMDYVNQVELMPGAVRRECYEKIRSSGGELAGLLGKLNPLFTGVLGSLPEVVSLDAEKEQMRFVAVCANVIRGLGDASRPAVLILDDLQWTEQGSMDILYDIWLHIASVPLLIVGCFREKELSQDHPLMRCRSQARFAELPFYELLLAPFSQYDVEQLLGALMRTKAPWTSELASFVSRKSTGIPLYAFEILRQLVGKDVLSWRTGQWCFDRDLLGKINIPDAIVDVVMSRISTVDDRLTGLLSFCALIGKHFSVDFLLSLPDMGNSERVVTLLDTAVDLEFIEWDPQRSGFLFFLHDRIRDAFAARFSTEQRSRAHECIAAALEKSLPAAKKETLFILVHHFSHSGDWQNCLRYALVAAKTSRDTLAITLAIHYYELAMRLVEEKGSKDSLEWKTAAAGLIDLYPLSGNMEKADALANDLFAYAKTPLEQVRLHRIMSINHLRVSSYDRAGHHFARGLALLGKRIPSSPFATFIFTINQLALYPLTALLWPLRSSRKRKQASERDREIALFYQSASMLFVVSDYVKYLWVTLALMNHARRTMGASKELAGAISSYAMVFMAFPWISRCLFHNDRALTMQLSVGDKAGVAESHSWLGFAYCMNADWAQALKHLSLARETCETIGDFYQLVHVLNALQNVYYLHTDTGKRLPVLKTLLSVSERIGSTYGTAIALTGLGGHYLMLGDFDASNTFLDKGVAIGTSAKQWLVVCIGQSNRARMYLEKGDLDRALEHINLAEEIEQSHSLIKPVVAIRYIIMVEVLVARCIEQKKSSADPDRRKSLDLLRKEVRKMDRATRRWLHWRGDALRVRAQFHACRGNTGKAEADFRTAAALLTKTGKNHELAKCYYHFGKFLIDTGRLTDAVPFLHLALGIFRTLGAEHLIERTMGLLGTPKEERDKSTEVASDRLASFLEVSRSLGSLHDLETLLKEILSKAVEVTGANRGYLFLVNDSNTCELRVGHNGPSNETDAILFSKSIVEQVQNSGRTVLTINAAHQESFKQFKSVSANDMKSILCVPILRRGAVLGVCYLDNSITTGVFDGNDREMIEAFMAQAAVCIENARAFEEIRRHNRTLADERDQVKKRNAELQDLVQFQASHLRTFGGVRLVTQNSTMIGLIEQAKRFADSGAPVLITGASGCGKEIFAHLVHYSGRRKEGPFVKVNCSAIPETLFESEFFGYEKGAFTGASSPRKGKFELADGGTLMLDEIGDLPLSQQAKLLRVLEENAITPIGGSQPRKVNVRVVAATNSDIAGLVAQNKFRQDLFFRLSVLNLVIPSLSQRPDDIPVLASYFLSSIANAEGGREKRFDDPALLLLREMEFQGNVRQLKNLVHRLYVTYDKELITADDIVQSTAENRGTERDEQPGATSEASLPQSFFQATKPYRIIKEEFEKQYLRIQLKKHGSNLTRTAKALDLLPSALSRKLKDLGIGVNSGTKKSDRKGSRVGNYA
jgi:transcriptional regulator with GAF, ATPase, and Fis domain/serine/threonine protein kinase/tetratricopeptide (TPR) repeat protein